jgi:hypothetical protein
LICELPAAIVEARESRKCRCTAKARGVKLGGKRKGASVPEDARQRGRKAQQRASDLRDCEP